MKAPTLATLQGSVAGRSASRSPISRHWHAVALALLFVVSLPAVTTRIYASDEIQYFAFLRSLWFDHDLSFDNEYRYFYDHGIARAYGFHETHLERTTETGHRLNFGTVGCALLWAPFYLAADLGVRVAHAAGASVHPDGFSRPYISAVCYASAVYGLMALLVSALAAGRLLEAIAPGRDHRAAVTASALVVWAGTPLAFYTYLAPAFAHACSAFVVAVFLFAWLCVRRQWTARGLIVLGALAALMAMVREQDIFFVVGPAIDFALSVVGDLRARHSRVSMPSPETKTNTSFQRLLLNLCVGCLAFVVTYLPQAIAYLVLNGRIGPSRLVARKMSWASPHAVQVLLSPEHGILFWTPAVALALAGLVVLWLRSRGTSPGRVIVCLLAMVAAQIYIAGSVESWTVAGAFGQRRFVGLTPLLVIGLAGVLIHAGSRWSRYLLTVLLAVCVWWNVALMIQFGSGLMDRQRLELGRNAWNAFVVVPGQLPRLAYRYAFERGSFYQQRSR